MPSTTKDCATASEPKPSAPAAKPVKRDSSWAERAEAMNAPPPKPMIAMPVASPGRSGNHLISVETGLM